jgi:hypothetical protein
VLLSFHGDVRGNLLVLAGLDVGFAEVAAVGNQLCGGAKFFRQYSKVFKGRNQFLLVIRLLGDMGRNDELCCCIDTAGNRHDPGLCFG